MGQKKSTSYYNRLRESTVVPFRFSLLMLLVFFIQVLFHTDLGFLGILPNVYSGLIGVAFAPLIHGSNMHLYANIFPVIILGSSLYFFYDRVADQVFFYCYFMTNFIVWLFGRPYYHIGASGLVYGLAMFLIALGFFRGSLKSIMISVVIIIFYGGIIYGVLPTDKKISWESHLAGAVVGMMMAFFSSKKKYLSSY
ncbi:rhomboid family intramembrane serine protease [Lunatibacter salilacus]|uniref:rhomboid family intramembrane serine protease n=1 Tax=Lunatibacter salilacus TaxID=2483804 RepID=UPI001F443A03|nr:rhomboid family intramembrane serine protease [Lunatibacter salilacus]